MFTGTVTVILVVGLGLCSAVSAEPVLRWEPAAAVVSVDQEVTVSIVLDEPLDVRTFEVFVQFDPDLIATVGGGPGALFDGFTTFDGFAEDQPGQWHGYSVILGAEAWTTGPGELFKITVSGLQAGISPLSTDSLTLRPPGGGHYPDADLAAGSIQVIDLTGVPQYGGAVRMGAFPNPFNPSTTIWLDIPRSDGVTLAVHDFRGRLVRSLWRGSLTEGRHPVSWDGLDDRGAQASSGAYLVRLVTADGAQRAVKVTLSK